MPINETFIAELQQEAATTKKILERVPLNDPDWKPHEKSMTLGRLAAHVAELSTWVGAALDHDELDFAKSDYKPPVVKSAEELTALHDKNIAEAIACLKQHQDEDFMKNWKLRNGETIYFELPKAAVLRSFVFSHMIHHRAQLGVYLRLLNIPLPGSYGPTADEQAM
jgi:uncharacterized damage-inducible protein DinB